MRRVLFIATLIIAGEMIFSLPFHPTRFFRSTFLEAFGFTNTQLGDAFAIYGVTAMISYFPGGMVADHFSPRALLTASLFATAAGGLYMATFPGFFEMALLYGYWGVTSIFLFWAALISATRHWGGERTQGVAFGILDGGRGLAAAILAVLGAVILAVFLPAGELVTTENRLEGFRNVILFYSATTAAAGILTWIALPHSKPNGSHRHLYTLKAVASVVRRPVVWAQAAIIISAYCGYKGLDNFSLYAVEVMGMTEVEAAKFTAYTTYLRPVAAIVAGVLADRFAASKVIVIVFLVLSVSYAFLTLAAPDTTGLLFIYANILISMFGVFALRGVYFALLQETSTAHHLTGTTVGMVSFIGFSPEVFFGPITGRILDASPGLQGHQNYFMFLAAAAGTGFLVAWWLIRTHRRRVTAES
jgi:sugar phosphate permease